MGGRDGPQRETARCLVGGALFVATQIAAGNPIMVVFQLMVSGSLLALLLGNAGRARIFIACGVFGVYAVFEIVGLVGLATRG